MCNMKRTARHFLIALAIVSCARIAVAGLPLTPNTTYVANSTPVIKAADLNQLQTYLSGLYSALYSVKALVIDGTGGAGVTPLAGSARVSATVSGFSSSAPFLLSTVPWGANSQRASVARLRALHDGCGRADELWRYEHQGSHTGKRRPLSGAVQHGRRKRCAPRDHGHARERPDSLHTCATEINQVVAVLASLVSYSRHNLPLNHLMSHLHFPLTLWPPEPKPTCTEQAQPSCDQCRFLWS